MKRLFICGHARTVQPWRDSSRKNIDALCIKCKFAGAQLICTEVTREVKVGSKVVRLVIRRTWRNW